MVTAGTDAAAASAAAATTSGPVPSGDGGRFFTEGDLTAWSRGADRVQIKGVPVSQLLEVKPVDNFSGCPIMFRREEKSFRCLHKKDKDSPMCTFLVDFNTEMDKQTTTIQSLRNHGKKHWNKPAKSSSVKQIPNQAGLADFFSAKGKSNSTSKKKSTKQNNDVDPPLSSSETSSLVSTCTSGSSNGTGMKSSNGAGMKSSERKSDASELQSGDSNECDIGDIIIGDDDDDDDDDSVCCMFYTMVGPSCGSPCR